MGKKTFQKALGFFLSNFSFKLLRRIFVLLTADIFSIVFAFVGAYLIVFPVENWNQLVPHLRSPIQVYLPEFIVIGIIVFTIMGFYRTLWRYASVETVFIIVGGASLATIVPGSIFLLLGRNILFLWPVLIIYWMILILMVSAGRFSIRLLNTVNRLNQNSNRQRVLIYGAGDAGDMICRDLIRNKAQEYQLLGFVDDDESKHHKSIHNLPIFGGREKIEEIVDKKNISEIILAMPSIPGVELRAIHDYLKKKLNGRVQLKTIPGIYELIDGVATVQQIRQFRVRDLLRRKPVELDKTPVDELIRDKSILVSGAGGSIGSEICRQVCMFSPKRLIAFDISEASLYLITEQLRDRFGDVTIIPIVGDVCNRRFVENIFKEFHPEIIFHAAAYKHVPLMEFNPYSAVYNNVYGTRVLSDVSAKNEVERFVMISTDKAVRPTSMMGATKRLCEMVVQMQDHSESSIYCVVRFGNVMGSSGSVIPKFDKQIKKGGPVTVTDRRATRYFMLTSEAVQLVMQAATLKQDDAIYILDMGTPIKIMDLAYDMIRLSGLEPNVDIKIEYTGLRPGEKLHEELYYSGHGDPTPIEKITVTSQSVQNIEETLRTTDHLLDNCYKLTRDDLYLLMAELVEDYQAEDRGKCANYYNHNLKADLTEPKKAKTSRQRKTA